MYPTVEYLKTTQVQLIVCTCIFSFHRRKSDFFLGTENKKSKQTNMKLEKLAVYALKGPWATDVFDNIRGVRCQGSVGLVLGSVLLQAKRQ